MGVERIFDHSDIQLLLENNSSAPTGKRDCALIMSAVCWGLKPSELSLLRLEDVMDQSGDFYHQWILPDHISYNGESRIYA